MFSSRKFLAFAFLLAGFLDGFHLLADCNHLLDDSFISFRYARNLVEGQGLTCNPGERVEGYTNLLFVLFAALPLSVGMDPVFWTKVLSLVAGLWSLLARLEAVVPPGPVRGRFLCR